MTVDDFVPLYQEEFLPGSEVDAAPRCRICTQIVLPAGATAHANAHHSDLVELVDGRPYVRRSTLLVVVRPLL